MRYFFIPFFLNSANALRHALGLSLLVPGLFKGKKGLNMKSIFMKALKLAANTMNVGDVCSLEL